MPTKALCAGERQERTARFNDFAEFSRALQVESVDEVGFAGVGAAVGIGEDGADENVRREFGAWLEGRGELPARSRRLKSIEAMFAPPDHRGAA